mmetsp:Transcript_35241/g.78424  ORF Transcript_35241/g.78424 Transcript_35241/m.78424 type:complete len:1824 (+) Transcript_35241:146-5617(+)|eukprot:CAMPEP_0202913308 /NCGR_PEP_ID=MMETSP1392-20130828/60156_1 /ASSEMBLY_ACC=CAM_ASM_000868 /TAXON_ID=225041 /ORGANISM="Chlamydomonas chlamydogama, Strain SAG 11-48b" /LENGTH=1823 /DNA_ID=CAMNT_0049604529 /DNA_START=79 /DNA_END=5550 /DNA_ORIENTATION=+
MTDILKRWLADDVGLRVDAVEKDFANGYLLGQLFHQHGMLPDFDKFEDNRTPDSMVNNYTRLQPTFSRLGIKFDTRTANSLMREEPGVAVRLLYSVKQNLGQVHKDVQKFQNSGRLGKELGASVPVTRNLLDAQQYRTQKEKYESTGHRFFEDTMRRKQDNPNMLMESMHLRKFTEEQYKQERRANRGLSEEQAQYKAQQAAFRKSLQTTMSAGRTEKSKKLQHDDAVHAAILKRKEEIEREELRVELALSEKSQRKKLEELNHASLDVAHGIDAFEINMKRLVKGDSGDDQYVPPPPGAVGATTSPMEHMNHMRTLATSPAQMLEGTAAYMAGVKAQRGEDLATKKEREARRRRMVVEQQEAAARTERNAQAEALVAALARQSNEEQRLAGRLWQLRQEKEVMRENRVLREQQYQERREKDWEETLRRELELHRSLKEQYETEAKLEMDAWRAAQQAHADAKARKHAQMCEEIAWQVVMIAERAAQYRETTGAMVPIHEYRRWLAMFKAGDVTLGAPVIKSSEEDQQTLGIDPALAKAAAEDYMECVGEFERPEDKGGPIGSNAHLGKAVADLADACRHKIAPGDLPQLDFPLRLAIVGAPFSGKTLMAQELSRRFKIRLLDPEALVAEAIKAAEAYRATLPAPTQQPTIPEGAEGGEEGGEQASGPAVPPPPPLAELGLRAQAALAEGSDVPDEVLVALVVNGMQESATWTPPPELDAKGKPKPPPKPAKGAPPPEPVKPQGFVVDGFPRTEYQSELLERALTGLNLDEEKEVVAAASRLAPPPLEAVPQTERLLRSGLDAVIVLGLSDEDAALKRALGRRLDPQTGRIYHLEFDPPEPKDPGLAARLQMVKDPANDAVQVQRRLMAYQREAGSLDSWLKRFNKLRRPVEGFAPVKDVVTSVTDVATSILRAKQASTSAQASAEAAHRAKGAAEKAQEFAELARAHAEAAARELLAAKKAELAAQALLTDPKAKNPDPGATEVLKAQSAAKCAEQLKVCKAAANDAAGYAERAAEAAKAAAEARDRALESLGDAEVSASAEAEAKAFADDAEKARQGAADAAGKSEVAKSAAEVAAAQAEKFATVESLAPDAKVELAPPAPDPAAEAAAAAAAAALAAPAQPVLIPGPLAGALLEEWRGIESSYLEGLTLGLANITEEHGLCTSHFEDVRRKFRALLERKDTRPALVSKFQQGFNAVDVDARKLKETQGELVLRAEELREQLWALCDKKMEDAEAERARVAADSFVADHSALLAQYFTGLAQVELDRFASSVNFARGYVNARYGQLKAPAPGEEAAPEEEPLVAPDLTAPGVPPELKDKLDEKSKTAMQFPAPVTALAPKAAGLATALKVVLATAANVAASLNPAAEDPKKAGKKPTTPSKGAKGKGKGGEEDSTPKVDPKITAAIQQELQEAVNREVDILQARALLLAERAAVGLEAVASAAQLTHARLGEWVRARYQAECSAVAALEKVVKEAAMSGLPLPHDLRLEDDGLVVDQGAVLVPGAPELPPPVPVERQPPASLLSSGQLAKLGSMFSAIAPNGFVKLADAAQLMCGCITDSILPGGWKGTSIVQMQAALRAYDPMHTGYVDWREVVCSLLAAAFPLIMQSSCADMADQVDMLSEADADKDGYLTEAQWSSVELWFQYKMFAPGAEADLEGEYALVDQEERKVKYDSALALKQVLWDMFALPLPAGDGLCQLDFKAVLLYLCPDRDMFTGIKKAFSVASNSIASNARVTAEQLLKAAYPLGTETGKDIHRVPLDLAAVEDIVKTVYTSRGGAAEGTPSVTAEQVMYSAGGEKLMAHLLHRYQWKDAYTASKLV